MRNSFIIGEEAAFSHLPVAANGKVRMGTFLKLKLRAPRLAWGLALTMLLAPQLAVAEQGIEAKGFKFAPGGYFPPPHEKQVKSLLTGGKAQPQGKRYLITDGKFETFLENGQREMLVEAPQCFYDESGDHSIYSSGPLRVEAAEKKFVITGEGFRWQQTNSSLVISNRVHTILRPELLQPKTGEQKGDAKAQEQKGIEIFSEHFDYSGDVGIGHYRRNVRVEGTNLNLSAGRLEFLLPMKQRQLQRLTADENVVTDSGELRAKGQHVVYVPETSVIQLTGDPTWQAAERRGHADELSIDQSNRIFRAIGHAYLEMQSQNATGFLPGLTATNAPSSSNQVVEIRCGSYEIRTNSAQFHEQVFVSQKATNQSPGTLKCGTLTATFSGTNQMQRMVAEESVVIEQGTRGFNAKRAVYTATNGILELSGAPGWKDGDRSGKGDALLVNMQRNELTARGKGSLRLPAGELSETSPAQKSDAARTSSTPNQYAEITSNEYTLGADSAVFRGRVRIMHPQMDMTCDALNVALPGEGAGRAGTIVAQKSVVFVLTDEKGQQIRGTGEKAVYRYSETPTATNDFVQLTGNPVLTTTNGGIFQNSLIVLDRVNGKVFAPGDYRIRGVGPTPSEDIALSTSKRKTNKRKVVPEFHD